MAAAATIAILYHKECGSISYLLMLVINHGYSCCSREDPCGDVVSDELIKVTNFHGNFRSVYATQEIINYHIMSFFAKVSDDDQAILKRMK